MKRISTSQPKQQPVQQTQAHGQTKRVIGSSSNRRRQQRQKQQHYVKVIKLGLVLAVVCIFLIYIQFLIRIKNDSSDSKISDSMNNNGTTSNNIIMNSKSKTSSKAVMIIAAAPFHSSRAYSIWSQLQCFTDNIDKVIITAADFTKEYLDILIQEAIQTIPHLKDGTVEVEVQYYKNDNYDMGLWCNALSTIVHDVNSTSSSSSSDFDHFMLINDSIMAIRRSSELIDITRSKDLTLGSLTYSLLGGTYWLEANYRSFNIKGINTYMNYTCIPNHCLTLKSKHRRHRCMVQRYEIPLASYFHKNEVWGIYHADAPIEYYNATAKNKHLQTSPMWHGNYPFWDQVLRKQQNFPASKISNVIYYVELKKKNKDDYDRCLTLLDQSKKAVVDIMDKFDTLLDKTESHNQILLKKKFGGAD